MLTTQDGVTTGGLVGALPKPAVPDGPIRDLSDRLHALHHRAGWPSLRDMARDVGCSHTTISAAFSEPRVPRWGLLELIVETLGGDTDAFHKLWLAASVASRPGDSDGGSDGGGGGDSDSDSDGRTPPPPGATPPRDLPADVAGFTGRADELATMDRLLSTGRQSRALLVSAVSGTAGVGKTALALHWAHRVADEFPDGQLHINLRGYDPDKPVHAAEALEVFLRELGVAGPAIPPDVAARASKYRTLIAGRRMLVVLDNAASVDQLRDLLPGTASCVVVVTSRDTLPALVARHGAVRINLDLLSAAEANDLLRTLIGQRVDAEPDQATELARRCARLPLALRIAAELAAARPATPLADLVAELDDESGRLDLLAAGDDEHTAVRTVFSWSYRSLDADAAGAFRLLGLHPGGDFDDYAAAALIGTDLTRARRLIDVLARAHLVEARGLGHRFGMHDLLHAYAAEQAAVYDGDDRLAAQGRLYDYYLSAAMNAAPPAFLRHGQVRPAAPETPMPLPPLTDPADAAAWLDRERANLLAVAAAAVRGWPSHAHRLAVTLAGYLDTRGGYADALVLYGLALDAARSDGDRAAESLSLNLLGSAYRRLGRYAEALDHHEQALALHRETGDRRGEGNALHKVGELLWRTGRYQLARDQLDRALAIQREVGDRVGEGGALNNLGIVYRRLGRYPEALEHYQHSVDLYHDLGDRIGEASALTNLGIVHLRLGHYAEALDHHRRALAIFRTLGNRTNEGLALTNLGDAYERLTRYDEALDHHRQAYTIVCAVGFRAGQGDVLRGLGVAYARLGRFDEAIDHLRRAIAIGHEIGEADLETGALNDLGEALRAAGRPAEAVAPHRLALALAEAHGDRYEQARALVAEGLAARDLGDEAGARRRFGAALDHYTSLGVPEAGAVADQLATTEGRAGRRDR